MKTYLVGGAVRDQLLGLPVEERDWVVVGATASEMLAQGFKQVGKDFPVFLHPKTHEEYALARTERKTGKGYTQFETFADPNVTLEKDLMRRDLTINAMAQTEDGKLIDPYGGTQDLNNKILRHVSPAFAEDPVRILRTARFAAKFSDFTVHPTTNTLMQQIVANGELDALVPERVWQELERALRQTKPQRFFTVLQECGALEKLFPEIAKYLIEIYTILDSVNKLIVDTKNFASRAIVRFAALFYYSTKDEIKAFCKRFRVPTTYEKLALQVCSHKNEFTNALKLNAEQLLQLFEALDVTRQPERFEKFLLSCEAGFLAAKIGVQNPIQIPEQISPSDQLQYLHKIYAAIQTVSAKQFLAAGFVGAELGKKIREAKLAEIRQIA